MKRLSIIIPMYNVEPFVERCIRSLESQDIPKHEYEIICINDGSPDNCSTVVKTLQEEYDNIVLIEQENKGVSIARNNGIDVACGKYLLFIDPDDYIDTDSLCRVLTNAEKRQTQVSFLGFTFLTKEGNIRRRVLNDNFKSLVFNGIDSYTLARGDGKTDPDRMWAILFETEFINRNKLRFLSDVPYLEDGELVARILCIAERCIFDGNSFYQRTTRPGSATNSKLSHTKKATNGFFKAARNLKNFQKEKKLEKGQRVFLNQPICKFVLLSLFSTFSNMSEFKSIKNKLKNEGLGRCNLQGCNNYYKIEGFFYNVSPYLFLLHRKIGAPLLKVVKP